MSKYYKEKYTEILPYGLMRKTGVNVRSPGMYWYRNNTYWYRNNTYVHHNTGYFTDVPQSL